MAEKARDAFRTISEVANWLDVPAHVLRFWESKFSQIKPVKRAGGRRYYRPDDMRLIGGIKQLLHDDGLTIRGVQKMLKEEGVKHVSGLSPEIDMPSEEEGAARRDARRARRQTRQSSKTVAAPATLAPSAEAALKAEDTETIAFDDPTAVEVAAAPPSQSDPGDVAPTASVPTHSDEAPSPFEPAPPRPSEDVTMPGESRVESPDVAASASDAQNPSRAPSEPNLFAEEDAPQGVAKPDTHVDAGNFAPLPDTTAAQRQDSAPAPDPVPAPDAPPKIDIPADPASDSIHASPAQRQHAATLRALRSRIETDEISPRHHEALRSVMQRMQALHDRMVADGARS